MRGAFVGGEIFGGVVGGFGGGEGCAGAELDEGEDFFVASYNLETKKRVAYPLQRNEWSIHFNLTKELDLFCGDGGDPGQVAHAPDGEWLYLFRPEMKPGDGINTSDFIQPGVFHAERLVNMSKHNYRLEPNVSFTPDQKWVIFRSSMYGPTYVFAVEVAKDGDRTGGK